MAVTKMKTPAGKKESSNADANLLKKVEKRFASVWQTREDWLPRWKLYKKFIDPERGRFDVSKDNKGQEEENVLLNETSILCQRILAAGMQSGLTSPSMNWFRLQLANGDLGELEEMKIWLADAERALYEIFAASGIYKTFHNLYEEEPQFGTACTWAERSFETVIRTRPFTCGEYGLGSGENGKVNRFAREFSMSASALVETFGLDKVSEAVRRDYNEGRTERRFTVRHFVEPNPDIIKGAPGRRGAAFVGYYWQESNVDAEKLPFLRIDTHERFPVMAPRWTVIAGDTYGRKHPGSVALGASKQLQMLERESGRATKKAIDPSLVAPASLKDHPEDMNFLPGGISYIPDTAFHNGVGIRELHQVRIDSSGVQNKIVALEQRIREIYYTDLFTMLSAEKQANVTATAITEQIREKMTIIGPVIENNEDDLLDPMIDFAIAVGIECGAIPPPPEIAEGEELKIEYISVLAQAQKSASIPSTRSVVQFAGELGAIQAGLTGVPEVLEKIDFDRALDVYASVSGTDPRLVLSDDIVAGRRAARKKQMERQAAAEQVSAAAPAIEQGARAAKELSEASMPSQGMNALEAVLGGGGLGGV